MAFDFNGNIPSEIGFNGDDVTELAINGETVWRKNLFIFDGGITRSGDSWTEIERSNNDSNDELAEINAYCSSVLYAHGACGNYDRQSVAGGMLTKAIDITPYSKLCVTISSASIINTNNSQWFAGVRNSVLGNTNDGSMPWISGCTLFSQATSAGTYTLDLSTYKNTYGNTAYFLYGAGKTIQNAPNGGATVTITKVWFE